MINTAFRPAFIPRELKNDNSIDGEQSLDESVMLHFVACGIIGVGACYQLLRSDLLPGCRHGHELCARIIVSHGEPQPCPMMMMKKKMKMKKKMMMMMLF